jgi:hypothetical protein
MDPISAIVTAVALGASSALKDLSAQSLKDAYAGLKNLIQRKYSRVSIAQVENAPDSKIQRAALEEAFKNANAEHDEELLSKAKDMIDAVRTDAPEAADAIGVDLKHIKSASLRIADVIASGSAVRLTDVEASGDINIEDIRSGPGADTTKKA